jgi:hypothetical protein
VIDDVDAIFGAVFWMETFWTLALAALAAYFALKHRR